VNAGWQFEQTSIEKASAVERMLKGAPHDEQRTSMRCMFGCFKIPPYDHTGTFARIF